MWQNKIIIETDSFDNNSHIFYDLGATSIQYFSILTKLSEKDYNGFLSLEPHLGSFEGLASLELDDEMLKLEKSDASKFTLAYTELKKILDKIN